MSQSTDPFPEEFLALIRCPITSESLEVADENLVRQVNQAIVEGNARSRLGDVLDEPFEGGLVNRSRTWLYRVTNDIPSLLVDEALALQGLVEPVEGGAAEPVESPTPEDPTLTRDQESENG